MSVGLDSNSFDVIVIGIGAMGSATCYELAKRGKRVLGIERFGIPHMRGSSHGYTRIIRLAYYEHPSYVLLLKRAYELWREIEQTAGEQLLHITGSIDAGPEHEWVFKGSWDSCRQHDLPHEVLTGSELRRRFPGFHLPNDTLALLQPDGGFLRPERCIVSFVTAAQALGAAVHGHEEVLEWQPAGDGVRVTTDRDTYSADKLVISAGAWNSHLIDCLDGVIVPERQVLAWLQPSRPELFAPERFPVFNLLVEEGRFYGFPVFDVPGFKFGKYHHFLENVDAEDYDRAAHGYDETMLRQFAERYFPHGCGPTMNLETCMFTNTADNHFVIDMHPVYPQVAFASPCSGHGFKFASVIGEIMADLATTGLTRHDVSLFGLERLVGEQMYARRGGKTMSRPVSQGRATHMDYGRRGARDDMRHPERGLTGSASAWSAHGHGRAYSGTQYQGPVWSAARLPEERDHGQNEWRAHEFGRRRAFAEAEDVETFW